MNFLPLVLLPLVAIAGVYVLLLLGRWQAREAARERREVERCCGKRCQP
jgi:cytochrome oxidase assembly protein ShyY1